MSRGLALFLLLAAMAACSIQRPVSSGTFVPVHDSFCAALPPPPWRGPAVEMANYPGLDAALLAAKATIPKSQQAGSWFDSDGGQTVLNVGVVSPTAEQRSAFAAAAHQDHTSIPIRTVTVPLPGGALAARQAAVTKALLAAQIVFSADSRPDVGVIAVTGQGTDEPAAAKAIRGVAPACSVRVLSGNPALRT